jgi:hypothetical protein
MHLGAEGLQCRSSRIRAGQTDDLMPGFEKLGDNGRPDGAEPSGDEYLHGIWKYVLIKLKATVARSSTGWSSSMVAGNGTAGNALNGSVSASSPTVGHTGRIPSSTIMSGSA